MLQRKLVRDHKFNTSSPQRQCERLSSHCLP